MNAKNISFNYFKDAGQITLFINEDGERSTRTVYKDESPALYNNVAQLISSGDAETLLEVLRDPSKMLNRLSPDLHVKDGVVFYKDAPVHNLITKEILSSLETGLPVERLVRFLESAFRNPSQIAVDDLYRFLNAHEGIPITEDGAVLMYKAVQEDFWSFFVGKDGKKVYWGPGSKPELPRSECDPNRDVACSSGLHVCSREYLQWFASGDRGHVVLVKVFPENIVSIPTDHSFQKCRCCKAEVLREIPELREFAFGSAYTSEGEEIEKGGIFSAINSRIFDDAEYAIVRFLRYSDFNIDDYRESGIDIEELTEQIEDWYEAEETISFITTSDVVATVLAQSDEELIEELKIVPEVSLKVYPADGDEDGNDDDDDDDDDRTDATDYGGVCNCVWCR